MMSALPLASARLSNLLILCVNHALDVYLSENIFYIHFIYIFCWLSNMILLFLLILPASQLQTQQVIRH